MSRQRSTKTRATECGARRGTTQPTGSNNRTHPILQLQKTIGNRAVQRLIARQCDSADTTERSERGGRLGPSLADIVRSGLNSSSQSLDAQTRTFMEAPFGYDFSGVTVHTDPMAAASAQAIHANAYAVGQDIVFGEGKYSPGSSEGKQLIAHELTHVVQQPEVASTSEEFNVTNPWDQSEQDAEQVAARIVAATDTAGNESAGPDEAGYNVPVNGAPAPTVSRQNDDENQQDGGSSDGSGDSGGVLGVAKALADPALELAGDVIPGAGVVTGPLGAALSGEEGVSGESTFDKIKGALGFTTGTVGTAAEMGGFSLLGGAEEAAAGSMSLSALPGAAGAGELGTLGLAGPAAAVLGAGLAGASLGEGMSEVADSSYTKTGAFGTNPDTGQNQSAMDWGANWGTEWDKAHNNSGPSIMGGILAGAGGIVGGISGAAYGAANWLADKL